MDGQTSPGRSMYDPGQAKTPSLGGQVGASHPGNSATEKRPDSVAAALDNAMQLCTQLEYELEQLEVELSPMLFASAPEPTSPTNAKEPFVAPPVVGCLFMVNERLWRVGRRLISLRTRLAL